MSQAHQSAAPVDQFQDTMVNVVYNFCSIFTTPAEMILRPQYGSRYFPPLIMGLSAIVMILLPFFSAMAGGISTMMPIRKFSADGGIFGIGSLSKLFFLCSFVHGIRVWYLMTHMHLEKNSYYEGPPLPIFRLFPFGFWTIRIFIEPLIVFAVSVTLRYFFILQTSAADFLMLAAVMLAMKHYAAWYQWWQYLRNIMDMRNAGPIIADIVDNQASDDDLETVHLASTKNLPEDMRRDFMSHVARVFSPGA